MTGTRIAAALLTLSFIAGVSLVTSEGLAERGKQLRAEAQ